MQFPVLYRRTLLFIRDWGSEREGVRGPRRAGEVGTRGDVVHGLLKPHSGF